MKHFIFLVFCIILLSSSVVAEKSIFTFMEDVDEYYHVVFGKKTLGGDTFAGTSIVLGIEKYNNVDIDAVMVGEISDKLPKIFLGTPCGNMSQILLGYNCDRWPYDKGYAVIKVKGENLIIVGTTQDDRRRAGLILNEYPKYEILANYSFVLVRGDSLDPDTIEIIPGKEANDFVCGDGICEPGETFLCFPDCNKKSCYDVCKEDKYDEAYCRDIPSNPNVPICLEGEKNNGMQYCAAQKSCCCKMSEPVEETPEPIAKEIIEEPEENHSKTVVIFAVTAVIIIILIGYIASR